MCYSWDQGALQSFGQCYGHCGGTMLPALERPGFPLLLSVLVIPVPVCSGSGRRANSVL